MFFLADSVADSICGCSVYSCCCVQPTFWGYTYYNSLPCCEEWWQAGNVWV